MKIQTKKEPQTRQKIKNSSKNICFKRQTTRTVTLIRILCASIVYDCVVTLAPTCQETNKRNDGEYIRYGMGFCLCIDIEINSLSNGSNTEINDHSTAFNMRKFMRNTHSMRIWLGFVSTAKCAYFTFTRLVFVFNFN